MEERSKKVPMLVAILILVVMGGVLGLMTAKNKTVSPLPESGLRVIFVSPQPTEIPTPSAIISATPRATATPRPRPTSKPQADQQVTPTLPPKPSGY